MRNYEKILALSKPLKINLRSWSNLLVIGIVLNFVS